MLAWMGYVTAVGSLLGVAALLAERGLRHLGRPVRWVWAGAMAGTVALPLALAGSPPVGTSATDRLILVAWAALGLALVANLRLSGWTLRRNERLWRRGVVEGQAVLVSAGFGPGVIGMTRPRVVLPRWVVDSDETLRRLIVTHEREHVRVGDPRLLLAGLILAALVPWCVPLWWQLHRLRGAMETDCDARVLAATGDPRAYASALVAVAGRRTCDLAPVPALAPGVAELKRRIALITAGQGDRSRPAGLGLLAIAAVAVLALAAVPRPALAPPAAAFEPTSSPERLPQAIIIFSVGGE